MDSRPLIFSLALLSFGAQAATLAVDSLVCETVSDLEFAGRELKGLSGPVVMEQAALTVKFYAGQANLARKMRLSRDQSPEASKAIAEPYASVVAACAVSGPGTATILERKPISGLAKIRTDYQGRQAEFWTYSANLAE